MSADPNVPVDPDMRSGGLVIKNMIYDGSSKGQLEIISHWRSYEGTRFVDQYNIPPYKPLMSKNHPCYQFNRALAECSDKLDPEMLLSGRCAACSEPRQALMRCLSKAKREERYREQHGLPPLNYDDVGSNSANIGGGGGGWLSWLKQFV